MAARWRQLQTPCAAQLAAQPAREQSKLQGAHRSWDLTSSVIGSRLVHSGDYDECQRTRSMDNGQIDEIAVG